jgi:hypothetical protein
MTLNGIHVLKAWRESGKRGFHLNGFGVADWARTLPIAALLFLECCQAMRKK